MSKHSYEALRSGKTIEQGMEYIVVFRVKGNGDTTAGVFLLDTYCLGVKNAFLVRFGSSERDEMLERIFPGVQPEPISPACAKKLIQDSVAYAQSLGLPPHADFRQASTLLNGIDAKSCDANFEFGKDGKPLYIQGPNDSAVFTAGVLLKLRERCGDGNYDFVAYVGETDSMEPFDFVEEEEEGGFSS